VTTNPAFPQRIYTKRWPGHSHAHQTQSVSELVSQLRFIKMQDRVGILMMWDNNHFQEKWKQPCSSWRGRDSQKPPMLVMVRIQMGNQMTIKKNLAQICLLGVVLLALPATTQAQFTFTTTNGSFNYTTNNGSITITSSSFVNYCSLSIPGTISNLPVTSIGSNAFYKSLFLTNVTIPGSVTNIGAQAFLGSVLFSVAIPDGVTSIGSNAFNSCDDMKWATIGNGVTCIGYCAFEWCPKLASVTIGTNVARIGSYAFNSVPLTGVSFPNSVTSIGDWAFAGTQVSVFSIPSSVTNIGSYAFGGSGSTITVDPNNPAYMSTGGVLFNKSQTMLVEYFNNNSSYIIPNSVTNVWSYAFFSDDSLKSVTIPSSVTGIGYLAFSGCEQLTNITVDANNPSYLGTNGVLFNKSQTTLLQFPNCFTGSYAIPNSVALIGDMAFDGSLWLTSVTIPNSVTCIGNYAFSDCGMTNVTIGTNVTSIGDHAFDGCYSLTSIAIPNSVTSIGNYAFYDCSSLTNVTIGNSVISIGDYAFVGCHLTSVTIPNRVTGIGNYAFYNIGLTNVTLGNNVTSIGDCAFEYTSLRSVTIPNSVTSIGDFAFEDCHSLKSVTLGNSVTSIGTNAFYYCDSLTNITIPGSVTSIGDYAFGDCSDLSKAYFGGNAPVAGSTVFGGDVGMVYYLPGTSGWASTFGGWPAAAWYYQPQPQILGSGNGFGAQPTGFQFTISWATNTSVVVLASTNLQSWTPLITNQLANGTNAFIDSKWTNNPRRFYRVRSP
jgi:hypothetical protein